MNTLRRTSLVIGCLCLLAACSSPADEPEVTYHADIKPVLDERCGSCHVPDGAGPYPLHDYENAKQFGPLALGAVEAGIMPPWSPDPDCREFEDQRIMPDAEIELLRKWVEADMPEGDPANAPSDDGESNDDFGEPDIVAKPAGPYTPSEDITDDYHCFLLDTTFEDDTYMIGSDVRPDNVQLVHHADIFIVSPYQEDTVEQLEADHEGPGYPCFGDPGFNSISLLGAWVPGAQPIFLPENSAAVIPKGSRLVLQTHFNTLYTDPAPVQPAFEMWTSDQPPENRVWAMPFANLNFEIPPGESNSVHETTYRNRSDKAWNVIGAASHMHLLGEQMTLEVVRDEDSEQPNACLIDIPKWDFDWQQAYRFKDDEVVQVHPGDSVKMTCVFDNSPENQPVVDGERLEPQKVTWGGKTNDEMCLGFLMATEPYDAEAAEGGLCKPFDDCRADCEDPYGIKCLFNCAAEDLDCGQCLLYGTQDCANKYCTDELRAATPCLLECAQAAQNGGDIDACLVDNCPDERDELEVCLRPQVEGGHCNRYIEECETSF
ncbi:MAG: hypothetical protein ACQEVA_16650 [Myxococcota bacterium]